MTSPASSAGRPRRPARLDAVRGAARLAVDGVTQVTRIAEGLHGTIAQLAPPLGKVREPRARGIAGFVYATVRTSSAWIGQAVDQALAAAQALLPPAEDAGGDAGTQRQALLAALNGVLGDHLERTANPLAITMTMLPRGRPGPRLLVLLHGLCMGEAQWMRAGHDHGLALSQSLGLSPVYVRYNTGRHVSANGADLAVELEALVANWPVPVEQIAILGHSMGGLVARSAVHQASEAGMGWPKLLRQLVFLGTPHHGAPLERGGNWLQSVLGVSPYLAPFARLGRVRSDGITDLRHGNLLQADWKGGTYLHRDTRSVVPLPQGVACYAVAGTLGNRIVETALGDGLVTVDSALGRHVRKSHDLHLPPSRTYVAAAVHHLGLLEDERIYRRLRRWLAS
jgi:pimeloyl-ACP methyl ester carboxylesterase